MNVIAYERVSTEEQSNFGFSLQHQKSVIKNYCDFKEYNIVQTFTEDYSGKDFNRPEWNNIMALIKSKKGFFQKIICLRWDRFSRNQMLSMKMMESLQKLGVSIETVEEQIDTSSPDSQLMMSIFLAMPEIENRKNSIRTTEGMRRARFEGNWTGSPPKGYRYVRISGKSILEPNQQAPLIAEAFTRMASGAYAAEDVRKWLYEKGMVMTKNNFPMIIRNKVYIGKVYVKPWKNEPESFAIGKHPPLISEDLFHRANAVLDGRRKNWDFDSDKTDLYPLKPFMKCHIHPHRSLTAAPSKGRKGNLYHYYFCPICKRTERHPVEKVHQQVEDVLKSIQISAETVKLYQKVLESIFDRESGAKVQEMSKNQADMLKLEQRNQNIQNMVMDGKLEPSEYHRMKDINDRELAQIKHKVEHLQEHGGTYKKYIKKDVPMLENLVSFYQKSNGETKRKILGCIFSEKFVLQNKKVAAIKYTTPIQVLLNVKGVLESGKTKKEVENDLFFNLAPSPGLEPGTP